MITYVSGGRLGDFLHQLSVVQEKFLATGQKGRVYLTDRGDSFRFGAARAYQDLQSIVSSQDYVDSFSIYADEPFDVDLSAWRQSPFLYSGNWLTVFDSTYDVRWGSHKWLTLPESPEYANATLIGLSYSPGRHPQPKLDWSFLEKLPNALFVTDSEEELDRWRGVAGSRIPTKVFGSLQEFYCAIHSCKLYIGNLSSPLAAAVAAYRPCVAMLNGAVEDMFVSGLHKLWPNFRITNREPVEEDWRQITDGDAMNRHERRAIEARSRATKATTPKVCLNMIVKNERAIIGRCLSAALPHIDAWVIIDTGSTDGTAEAIEQFFILHKVPGKLVRGTFKNFAQARNDALDAARAFGDWDYVLLVDADMVLRGPLDRRALTAPAYRLQQMTGNLGYWNTRLVRRDATFSYVGVTHEFLSVAGDTPPNIDSLSIDDRNDGGSKGDKGERDIRLLSEGLTADPNNGRYMFYLAQTYREMGRHVEAVQWYTKRIAAGGWDEEVWASYYGIARSYASLNDEAALVLAVFNAYNFRPFRAEPLSLLAHWWREHSKNDASTLLTEQVARMPRPNEILFIEEDVYERKNETDVAINGFYSKLPERRQAGYDACMRLTIDRDGTIRGESRANSVHYYKSAAELFGAETREIDWKPTDGYAPMNPSLIIRPDGQRLILVRTVNYTIADGQYPTIDGSGIIRTRNWIIEADKSWRTRRAVPMIDKTGLDRTGFPVEGFEDCRLYVDGDEVCASAVVRDLNAHNDGRCETALLALDSDWNVTGLRAVRDYEPDKIQKNWMPILGQPGSFVYLCDPTTVIDCSPSGTTERLRVTDLDQNLTEFRGGSQVIPHADGWVCLVHEVVWAPSRHYLHRFIRLNPDLSIRSVSEPFYFLQKGIEFAAGLARDGDRLVASFGVNDAAAHLAFFDAEKVDRILRE